MLRQLHISNLAIIERVDIELAGGLNVFTGQTGSGKSLILSALELLLGLTGGGEESALLVRPGADEARVSGLFELSGPGLRARLEAVLDQRLEPGEPILVTRRLAASGRSSAAVNGAPVTAGMLREAGALLVDIHGQYDQQYLLRPANQLAILDAFAGTGDDRERFGQSLRALRERQHRLAELRASEERRLEMLELYRFQLEELDKARLQSGEFEAVRGRYNVLKNVAQLKLQAGQILQGLSEGDGAIMDRLAALSRALQKLVRTDGSLANLQAELEQAEAILQDASIELTAYQERLDVDPSELARVEERLDTLNRLIHKYAGTAEAAEDPVGALLEHRRRIGAKVAALEADAMALGSLDKEIAAGLDELNTLGQRLSQRRRQAARKLRTLVEAQFRELEMSEAQFEARLESRPVDDPQLDGSGLDTMELLVRTNPGQELLPLRKIASGGEMSRIMLALKTILADKDQTAVVIFDEIDANVGDRLGATIGRKMRALAHGGPDGDGKGNHQVVCITHLSQIAACGDHHLEISKQVLGGKGERQTVARVRVLEGEDRVRELAAMLAGAAATDETLAHARGLLHRAQQPAKKG